MRWPCCCSAFDDVVDIQIAASSAQTAGVQIAASSAQTVVPGASTSPIDAVQGDVEITTTDFSACVADHGTVASSGATLAPNFVVYNSLASGISLRSDLSDAGKGLARETLSEHEWCKVWLTAALNGSAALTATFKLFADPAERGEKKIIVVVNSHALPAAPVDTRYTGWVSINVPVGVLRDGDNEFVLRSAAMGATSGCLFIDECYANAPAAIRTSSMPNAKSRCAKSFDAGKTWHRGCLGADGSVFGEYVCRLDVHGYSTAGATLESPVFDLADPSATGSVIAPASFSVASVGAVVGADTPSGTSVSCEVRSGATPQVAPAFWSPWMSVAQMDPSGEGGSEGVLVPAEGARFAQWRCVLSTSTATATPRLRQVTLTAQTRAQATAPARDEEAEATGATEGSPISSPALVLSAAENPPPLVRSGLPFVYMAPHPSAGRLKHELRLDAVLSQAIQFGRDHFPAMGEDFAQLVGLRTWVHAQWWGWQEAMVGEHCPSWSALEILHAVKSNFAFGQCTHFAAVFVGCAAACGFAARSAVMGGAGKRDGGHCLAEAWVASLGKWVVMDPGVAQCYSTHYVDATGMPLNVVEVHDLIGPSPDHPGASKVIAVKTVKFNEAPTSTTLAADPWLAPFIPHIVDTFSVPSRNDYTCAPELAYGPGQQGWLGYHFGGLLHYAPAGWHTRDDAIFTTARLADLYPSIGQVRLYAQHGQRGPCVCVRVETTMPNWASYKVQIDGKGAWVTVTDGGEVNACVAWPLHVGSNTIAVCAVSRFGVVGPPAKLELTLREGEQK